MKNYTIRFSRAERDDMQTLFDYISTTYKSYKTENDYQQGFLNAINGLGKYAGTFHTIKKSEH